MKDLFKKTTRSEKPLKIRNPTVSKSRKNGRVISPPIIYNLSEVEYVTNLSDKVITKEQTNDLTNSIIKWLELHRFFSYRVGNEGRMRENPKTGQIYRISSTLPRGFPDILAIQKKTGTACHIEVKSQNDSISEWQLYFIKTRQEAGIPAFVVYSYPDFIEKIKIFFPQIKP